ncbi:hypothetical protein MNBD_GAMMA04-1626 [hydrothermal vent metagenome]|uniref:HMA domain-containing protein n=1 Tax=hydrothermal vent metagenome TaxID=652676 RepID=A0A3B0WDF9_9ZZZZ
MSLVIKVENIKCDGCANQITKILSMAEGVEAVTVNVEQGEVYVSFKPAENAEALKQMIQTILLSNGYPEVGSVEGLKAAGAKAKSFVSCAIGKMTK